MVKNKMGLNRTEIEIVGFIYGLFFTFNKEDILVEHILPAVAKPDSHLIIIFLANVLPFIVFLGTILALVDVMRMIEKTSKIMNKERFNNYLMKIALTAIISFLSTIFLKNILFG